ncbi:hypothetical protein [Georgenia sp. SUBG003]|uniref:hypothetical protein n=1 Tax=Georgenia sp. SUBG003 TaxID=1497974 RepID=UPI003AB753AB
MAVVEPAAVREVPYEQRPLTPVTAVARPLSPQQVVSALSGPQAVTAVSVAQHHGPVVVLHDGVTVLGVVEVAAVARALQARRP